MRLEAARVLAPTARRWLGMVAAGGALGFLALVAVLETAPLAAFDGSVHDLVRAHRDRALDRSVTALGAFGSGWVVFPVAAAVFPLLVRRHRPLAVDILAVAVAAGLAGPLLKWMVARPRPRLGTYAFPSGHVLTAVVFFGLVVYVLWALSAPRSLRAGVAAAGLMAIGGASFHRLYFSAHWATDVLGGLLIGAVVVAAGALYADRRHRRLPPGRLVAATLGRVEFVDGYHSGA